MKESTAMWNPSQSLEQDLRRFFDRLAVAFVFAILLGLWFLLTRGC